MNCLKNEKVLLTIYLLIGFIIANINAVNHTISFNGTGASSTIDSVIVENLTISTSIKILSGQNLILTDFSTDIKIIPSDNRSQNINIFTRSIEKETFVEIATSSTEKIKINIFDLTGRMIVNTTENLLEGQNTFMLLLPKGTFILHINGNKTDYSGKVISQYNANTKPEINFIGAQKPEKIRQKNSSSDVNMTYSTNDQLIYKIYSGNFCSIVPDIPNDSKTINSDFVECKDANGRYYSTVKIGSQIWMAENLAYLPLPVSDFTIGLEDEENWETKSTPYYYAYDQTKYGVIYNWFAALTAAPEGWHLPSDTEWTELSNSLGGDLNSACKIKSTTDWVNDISSINSSGFTALPNGARANDQYFGNGIIGGWWSSSAISGNCYGRSLNNQSCELYRISNFAYYGFGVRCIKNIN